MRGKRRTRGDVVDARGGDTGTCLRPGLGSPGGAFPGVRARSCWFVVPVSPGLFLRPRASLTCLSQGVCPPASLLQIHR